MQHSIDTEEGGYFNCIHEDGSLYDTTKYVWLQGRQVWMFAKLYGDPSFNNDLIMGHGNAINKDDLLKHSISGAKFLIQNAFREDDGHVWFSLRKDGEPMQMQRKPWGACFLTMGLFELGRVMPPSMSHEAANFYKKGLELFLKILEWFTSPDLLGSKFGTGQPETSSLAVPMILLNLFYEIREMIGDFQKNDMLVHQHLQKRKNNELIDALCQTGKNDELLDICSEKEKWCIEEIEKHIKVDANGKILKVLETVGLNGEEIDSPSGRLINPGHVIEAGWFLMQYSEKKVSINSTDICQLGKSLATWALDYGWDKQFGGGILYFLDSSGTFSPLELEWDHKLWWPHTEALIAFIMAFEKTGELKMWNNFQKVAEFTIENFKDKNRGGEWYGYLNRRREVTHHFKGGPYKGCFHVPRAMWMCINILERICLKEGT